MHFFVPNGTPHLVVVDDGRPFKGMVIAMCQLLGIPWTAVLLQNHRTVRLERFFEYLNKVLKISSTDQQSFAAWWLLAAFGLYAWNTLPINGTHIVQSFCAKGRVFPFPIDITVDPPPVPKPYKQKPAFD